MERRREATRASMSVSSSWSSKEGRARSRRSRVFGRKLLKKRWKKMVHSTPGLCCLSWQNQIEVETGEIRKTFKDVV
jgi:hypothetical protein